MENLASSTDNRVESPALLENSPENVLLVIQTRGLDVETREFDA